MIVPLLSSAVRKWVHVAPWPIELVTSIPAVQYAAPASPLDRQWRRVAHLLIPDCRPGDLLECLCSVQVSNNLPFISTPLPNGYTGPHIVEVAGGLVLTPSSTGTAGLEAMSNVSTSQEPSGGRFITRMSGANVTPNPGMHHHEITRAARYIVPPGSSGPQYVALMLYCGGLRYAPTTDALAVDQYCGSFSVEQTRS